jgi:hypothetical protein
MEEENILKIIILTYHQIENIGEADIAILIKVFFDLFWYEVILE